MLCKLPAGQVPERGAPFMSGVRGSPNSSASITWIVACRTARCRSKSKSPAGRAEERRESVVCNQVSPLAVRLHRVGGKGV